MWAQEDPYLVGSWHPGQWPLVSGNEEWIRACKENYLLALVCSYLCRYSQILLHSASLGAYCQAVVATEDDRLSASNVTWPKIAA